MLRSAFLMITLFCGAALFAAEPPRLTVQEMTATGDYPDADLRTRLTQELRQRIANEKLFAVVDGAPQRALLAALPEPERFDDRSFCMERGCLADIERVLAVRAALWVHADCGPDSCFVTATLTPTAGKRPTVIITETPRNEPGLRSALTAIATRLGTPPSPAPTLAPEGSESSRALFLSGADRDRLALPEERSRLAYQNYVFILRPFGGASFGAGLSLGTLRWRNFQMEIAATNLGVAIDRHGKPAAIYYSAHLVGLGGKWTLPSGDGHDELGFMIGMIGGGATMGGYVLRIELLPSRLMYRYNMDSGGVFEAGLLFPLVWFGRDMYPNLTFYLGIGI